MFEEAIEIGSMKFHTQYCVLFDPSATNQRWDDVQTSRKQDYRLTVMRILYAFNDAIAPKDQSQDG